MPRLTKAQRIARQGMIRFLHEETLAASDLSIALRDKVPTAWHTLEHDLDVQEPKIKITLRLDASVAKFYRAMGHGYQARINRILALWANMMIGDALRMEQAVSAHLAELTDAEKRLLSQVDRPQLPDLSKDPT